MRTTTWTRHRFLIIGLLTFLLFLASEAGMRLPSSVMSILRILIVPMWVVWTLVTAMTVLLGGEAPPPMLAVPMWLVAFALGFVPYGLLDMLVARISRQGDRPSPADDSP
jgi:hypothetical protein